MKTRTPLALSAVLGAAALSLALTASADTAKSMHTAADPAGAVRRLNLLTPQIPVMHRVEHNRSIGIQVELREGLPEGTEVVIEGVSLSLAGTTRVDDVESVALAVQHGGIHANTRELGRGGVLRGGKVQIRTQHPVKPGETIWVAPILKKGANLDHYVATQIDKIIYRTGKDKKLHTYRPGKNSSRKQKIGYAVMKPGDLKSHQFRIPGLATSKAGTMLAVTDIRYPKNARDLPEDIDVGISRSTDNGQSWSPVKVIIDMGAGRHHGVGDPTVLVDQKTGRIFVAALYSQGNRGWFGSGPGMSAKQTGQFMFVHSDDDGKTWSKPYSITPQVKDPAWHLLFNGPGRGIQLDDGTLVMPAQFKDARKVAHSTIIHSADHGKTWKIGTGVRANTSESQVTQLGDGSILLTARDENKPGKRAFFVTRDLGTSWQTHPADKQLNCPTCQASIIHLARHGSDRELIVFANPARPHRRRFDITLSISEDEGKNWQRFIPVDERGLLGYSCMTVSKDGKYLGLFYEGTGQMYFVRYPISEL